jgi:excisionase family DNA binding protein
MGDLGLSKNAVYLAIAAKEIPSIRVGRRILVPRAAYERMLRGEAA